MRKLLPFVLIAMVGCRDDNRYPQVPVYPVQGQVRLANGKPLTKGHVYLVSKTLTVTPHGEIRGDGNFTIATGSLGNGAPEDAYRVRIEPSQPTRRLPYARRYRDEETSGLALTVKSPGSNPIFTLGAK